MAEYVERSDAVQCARDVANDFKNDGLSAEAGGADTVGDWLQDFHAADVRPVVLCKDCKWTKTDGMEDPAIYCEKWDRWEMPPDGFCWLGKKRKETTNGN